MKQWSDKVREKMIRNKRKQIKKKIKENKKDKGVQKKLWD